MSTATRVFCQHNIGLAHPQHTPLPTRRGAHYRPRQQALLPVRRPRTGVGLLLHLTPLVVALPLQADTRHLASPECPSSCITVVDYQSPGSPLQFSRTFTTTDDAQPTLPPRWRHAYESRLTSDGNDRVIFDAFGQPHRFLRQADGRYLAATVSDGTLHESDGTLVWTDASGIATEFQGSFPTRLHFPDDQTLRLDYADGQLHSISDEQGEQIIIEHEDGEAPRVHLPDGRTTVLDADPCLPQPTPGDATDEEDQCDTQANPVPGFDTIQTRPGVSTLDARPASCQSYFVEFYGTVRGEEIESGLARLPPYADMLPTNRSFPIIDFIDGNELVVVRSRDLASPSFNNPEDPEALHDRLLRDGAEIQSRFLEELQRDGAVTRTEEGRTTHIVQDPSRSISLHVLIRQNMASPEHWRQIEQARVELLQRYGIRLQVVIIP